MKILNKIFIVFFISILFFIPNTFATEETESAITTTLPSISELVTENDNWFIYYHPASSSYYLVVYNGHFSYTGNYIGVINSSIGDFHTIVSVEERTDNFIIRLCCGNAHRRYILVDNNWTENINDKQEATSYLFTYDVRSYICASNVDICNNEQILGNNDVVFQESPILSTLRGMNFRPMVWETMKETILGFLKYLIVFLISLTALYKGWQFLSTLLRGC